MVEIRDSSVRTCRPFAESENSGRVVVYSEFVVGPRPPEPVE